MNEKCPRCGGEIEQIAPKITPELWFCESCGSVYPEPQAGPVATQPDDGPGRYDIRAAGSIWDGEGP